MTPSNSFDCAVNGMMIKSKFICYFFVCRSIFEHFFHFCYYFFVKFCASALTSLCVSPFFYCVGNIFRISSNKKVFRIYARWIIASMQNMKSFFYKSIMNFPRDAMSAFWSIGYSVVNLTISMKFRTCPYPTFVGLFYFFKKTFFKGGSIINIIARSASNRIVSIREYFVASKTFFNFYMCFYKFQKTISTAYRLFMIRIKDFVAIRTSGHTIILSFMETI